VPTFERLRRFDRDFAALSDAQKEAFRSAVQKFVADLDRGQGSARGSVCRASAAHSYTSIW